MHGNPMPDSYVYVTEEGVTRHYADGSVEALAWEDVVEVRVVTESGAEPEVESGGEPEVASRAEPEVRSGSGPVVGAGVESGTDVLYILLDRDGEGCVVPRSATDATFLARLRYLPDFDLDRLAVAADSAHDGVVVVWRSPDPPSALPDLEYD